MLDGAGGFDYARYQSASAAVTASLADPSSNTGDAAGDTYLSIEGLIGSEFDDTLIGDAGDNILFGLSGGDALDGGSGFDIAAYNRFFPDRESPIVASLADPTINAGQAAGDTYISIEGLQGSTFGDTLIGDANANRLIGQAGDDTLEGGAGADVLIGNEGSDTASYAGAAAAVIADLGNPANNTGEAAGDTFISIEGLTGTVFGDLLFGDGGDNLLRGLGGNDTLSGGGGVNVLEGGDGNDSLSTFAGTIDGGAGDDFVTGFDGSWDVVVTGGAGNDTIDGRVFRHVDAGEGDDHVTIGFNLSQQVELIDGGAGHDVFHANSYLSQYFSGGIALDYSRVVNFETWFASPQSLVTITDANIGSTGTLTVLMTPPYQGQSLYGYTADASAVTIGSLTIEGADATDTFTGGAQSDTLRGLGGNDTLRGGGGGDALFGGSGDDSLRGDAGDDQIDGGGGVDTAIYAGNSADYTVTQDGNFVTVTGAEGTDTLHLVNRLQFADQTIEIAFAGENSDRRRRPQHTDRRRRRRYHYRSGRQ